MEFKNATIIKKANVYFDGNVTSRTVIKEDGERVTLGVMLPGEYTFSTGAKEIMTVLGGEAQVLLPDETTWNTYTEGMEFIVKANASFQLKVVEVFDYLCAYINE